MSETVLEIAAPECVAEDFDGEIVAINLNTGVYFSAKDAGAVLWRDLTTGHSVESLMNLAKGNHELAQSIARFAEDALSGGLMRKVQTLAAPPQPPSLRLQTSGAASLPFLESFSDMKSLLLLDPVHEVDEETGWPVRRPQEEAPPVVEVSGSHRQEPKE